MDENFAKRVRVVSEYFETLADEEWVNTNNLGGPFAFALRRGWITAYSPDVTFWVENSYGNILEEYGHSFDTVFGSLEELLATVGQ